MRVLVTGSRTWTDKETIWTALDAVSAAVRQASGTSLVVVHGAARGADTLADLWVRAYRGPVCSVTAERHPALWATDGTSAGHARNRRMIRTGADLCLAFIRDDSPGATKCAEWAAAAGIPLRVFRYGQEGVFGLGDAPEGAPEEVA